MSSLPPDPFDADADPGLGFMGEVVAEAELLWSAIEEARRRGKVIDAIWSLDVGDLRCLVLEVALREAWRRERFGGSE